MNNNTIVAASMKSERFKINSPETHNWVQDLKETMLVFLLTISLQHAVDYIYAEPVQNIRADLKKKINYSPRSHF